MVINNWGFNLSITANGIPANNVVDEISFFGLTIRSQASVLATMK
jgi:hypothetical protein